MATGRLTEHITLREVRESKGVVNGSDRFWQALLRWGTACARDVTTGRRTSTQSAKNGLRVVWIEDTEQGPSASRTTRLWVKKIYISGEDVYCLVSRHGVGVKSSTMHGRTLIAGLVALQ